MEKLKLEWRDHGEDRTKNFLEKLATFSINRVRKTLLPKLIKKTRIEPNKKRTKRNREGVRGLAFDPNIHVKTEKRSKSENSCHTIPQIIPAKVSNDSESMHESPLSEITSISSMQKRNDDKYEKIKDWMKGYFSKGGKEVRLTNFDDFLRLVDHGVGKNLNISLDHQLPGLEKVGESVASGGELTKMDDVILQVENEPHGQKTNKNGCKMDQENEVGEKTNEKDEVKQETMTRPKMRRGVTRTGNLKCKGDCDFEQETEEWKKTLTKKYGAEMMICKGMSCGRVLQDIMKKDHLAFVCKNCKERKCSEMYCSACYGMKNNGKRPKRKPQRQVAEL